MLFTLVLCAAAACAGVDARRHRNNNHGTTAPDTVNVPVIYGESGIFRGSWLVSRRGRRIQAYRGLRYAQAPVGELRFQPPVSIERYKSEVDGTSDGPACPQPVFDNYPVDEDCLRLNVYTPDNKKKLPVLVFIHAGGFYSVSGRSDIAGPQYLLDRDIVLVTINYRLGSLGFISTGDSTVPGNNGFKDQVVALKWVQKNIAAFGGDPNLVTIAGYSAGSFSVMLHMVSPMSKGLFHRAISMSGSPISQIVIPRHQRHLAVRQAKLLSCPTESSKAMIDCLKTKTSKELGDSLDRMFEFGYDPVLLWMPIQEEDFGQERFLANQPRDSFCNGDLQPVPFIVSQTQDEFFWKAFNLLNNETLYKQMHDSWHRIAPISFYLSGNTDSQADRLKQEYLGGKDISNKTASELGKLYSDSIIGFGVHRLANLMARHSAQPVYYYEFGYIGSNSHYVDPTTKKPTGAAHHDDLLYLFNVSVSFPSIPVSDSPDSLMVDKMTAMFYNFMRYGDPKPMPDTPELSSLHWPAFTPKQTNYVRIDKEFSVHQNLFEDRFKVWEELYPIDYEKCTNK
ncbi:unnamed protein product [Arctia plantaginis]|uniref:Carboxylic ester hydrolase n=1 Tax=Arctia plantaginis TaxID=874455 RepID=A0A8S0Z5F4_ARCPL|nr:unnamed protein product [Arctia plantaginis]